MRILGLDPGSRFTGYGLIERSGSRLRPITQGRIVLPATKPLAERLALLSRELRQLLERFEPEVAAIEALFRGINPKSLIVLAQARGVLLANLAETGLAVHEYSPAEIKSAVTGHGRAEKDQVGHMVKLILGLGEAKITADASDALAVAICFAQRFRIDRLSAGSSTGKPGLTA